jgi:formylglycine-generating enzyme required for sulfatase activity
MLMSWINPGSFHMGSKGPEFGPYAAKHHKNNESYHQVTISRGFWISTLECSQKQWQAVTGSNPSWFKPGTDDDPYDLPVENVSWNDIQIFLRKLNLKYPGLNARLPTEAEWEYCCRSGTTTAFYCGPDDITGDACSVMNLDRQGWYAGNSANWKLKKKKEIIPLNYLDISSMYNKFQIPLSAHNRFAVHHTGLKTKSAWGLGDFSGNVAEWCEDVYIENLGRKPQTDPLILSGGTLRSVRGGSWNSPAEACRSAARTALPPDKRSNNVGFRIVIPGNSAFRK